MEGTERLLLVREVAERANVSVEFVRAATKRGRAHHPLPCIESGSKRPVKRIRWSTFIEWCDEEERRWAS